LDTFSTASVIFDPRGRSDTSLFVRFAPKATFTNQDVIRRFVPQPASCTAANRPHQLSRGKPVHSGAQL